MHRPIRYPDMLEIDRSIYTYITCISIYNNVLIAKPTYPKFNHHARDDN